jgi:hypothetical protein
MVEMMIRFVSGALMALSVAAPAFAQDPLQSLPGSYKLAFENDYVKVVRVHYDAGAKLADHTHPAGTTVYVYLNDSDGIVFAHSSGSQRAVTRPPVKAGAVRIASGPEEHHSAENRSNVASDFLRISLKTASGGGRSTRRIPPGEREFANAQIRLSRLRLEQHDVETITAKDPVLLIEWPSGNDRWVDAGASTTLENHEARPVDLIRIDFLTRPQ